MDAKKVVEMLDSLLDVDELFNPEEAEAVCNARDFCSTANRMLDDFLKQGSSAKMWNDVIAENPRKESNT